MATLYEILEVSPKARDAVIRAAYRCLVQQCHPDKHAGDPGAAERMRELNHAYAVLADPLQRARYDQDTGSAERRGRGRTPAPGATSPRETTGAMRPFVFRRLV